MIIAAATAQTSCTNKEVTSDSFIGKWEAEYIEKFVDGSAPTHPFNVTITFTIKADGIYDEDWSDGTHEQSTWSYDETSGELFFYHYYWTVEKCTAKKIELYDDRDAQYMGYAHRMILKRVK